MMSLASVWVFSTATMAALRRPLHYIRLGCGLSPVWPGLSRLFSLQGQDLCGAVHVLRRSRPSRTFGQAEDGHVDADRLVRAKRPDQGGGAIVRRPAEAGGNCEASSIA